MILALIAWVVWSTGAWLFTAADWSVVSENLPFCRWQLPGRAALAPHALAAAARCDHCGHTAAAGCRSRWPISGQALSLGWLAMLPIGWLLLSGGLGLAPVSTRDWGGLTLTLMLTGASGLMALPLGILLALGAAVVWPCRACSAAYIDGLRAVPLIAVLFFGQLLLPLFLPVEIEINRVLRAVTAFALFAAAYVAEDVRGGLQAIPHTQTEAAQALGLSPWQTQRLVVLPQALRIAVPALTNQAIGLLQNTSLMAILGLVELLGISRSLMANPDYIGRYLETYVWLGAVYWLICTVMALLANNWKSRPPHPPPPPSVHDRCRPRRFDQQSFQQGQRALDAVTLEVEHGEVLVVMGPSGSGKKHLDPHLQRPGSD